MCMYMMRTDLLNIRVMKLCICICVYSVFIQAWLDGDSCRCVMYLAAGYVVCLCKF